MRVFFFWCLLAISFSLGTDGMLLALCDPVREIGLCAEIIIIIIIIMNQSGMVVNPACGRLNGEENEYHLPVVPVHA